MTASLSNAILAEGLDDWVPLLSVHFAAHKLYPGVAETDVRELIISTVQGLLEQRLVEIGDVSDDGFESWNVSVDAVRRRLLEAYATDDENWWGFVAWLSNTPQGAVLARQSEKS